MKTTEGNNGGSLQRMVRPRLSPAQIAERRRWRWRCNVERLKVGVLNMLTLGLGEGLWYGDVPNEHLNPPLLARLVRFVRVNLHNLKVAAAACWRGGNQIADARNERQGGGDSRVNRTDGNQVEVEVVHKGASRPNDPSSATRPPNA